MPFAPGNKHGNRNGRPRIRDSFAAAVRQKWPNDELIKLGEQFLSSKDEEIAYKTWQLLLAYAAGKPTEHVEVSTDSELTPEEFREEVKIMLREYVESLSAEQRAEILTDPVPTATIQ